MELTPRQVALLAVQTIAAVAALYYFLTYSSGCSFTRDPLGGRDGTAGDGGNASEGRGRAGELDADAVAALEQLDAGELEQLDAAAVDAGELEQLDAAAVDAGELDAGELDAGGAQCVLTCQSKGYPTGSLCNPSELPGKVLCCCADKPAAQ